MIAANVIDKSELPEFDEELGLLPRQEDSGESLTSNICLFITLSSGEVYQGMSVCMSIRACNSKPSAPFDLIFFTHGILSPWLGPPLR